MRAAALAILAVPLLAGPARADQSSFPMDYSTCLEALTQVASQLHVPLTFGVNTPTRKGIRISTPQGNVAMLCDRAEGTLTVATPPGQSILPYLSGGD